MSVSEDNEVCLSNAKFLFSMLKQADMVGCNPTSTPISKDMIKLAAHEADLGMFLDESGIAQYQADLGSLNWIAQVYCPKLAPTVSLLGKRASSPTECGPAMIKQALRWLSGNLDMCLKTQSGNHEGIKWYCDSDLAGLHAVDGETRSRMGILGTYNGMPFHWNSSWIKAVCNSSGEAEVYALSECVKMAVHFRWVCEELKIDSPERIPIYCDAEAAMGFFKNLGGVSQSRLKHIDLRATWVMEMRDSAKLVELLHIPGVDNPANFFTKVLGATDFRKESDHLMATTDIPEGMSSLMKPKKKTVATRGHGD
jgi:hypothetical protein